MYTLNAFQQPPFQNGLTTVEHCHLDKTKELQNFNPTAPTTQQSLHLQSNIHSALDKDNGHQYSLFAKANPP